MTRRLRRNSRITSRLGFEALEHRCVMAASLSLAHATVPENADGGVVGAVLVDGQPSSASKVTVNYRAHIATISGTPLGFTSAARNEIVTGSFTYDRSTGDVSPADAARGNYPHLAGGGAFQAAVLGTTITGSATPYVQIEDFSGGVSDTFRYIDGPRTIGNQGGIMQVNGAARQDMQLFIAFTDGGGTAFANDSLPAPLPFAVPPLSQPAPFWFPHTFSLKDAGGTMLLQLDEISLANSYTLSVSDSRFEIANGQLKLRSGNRLDYESQSSVSLDINASDGNGIVATKNFVIGVTNVNEAPTDIQISRTSAFANLPGAWIAAISVSDPDAGNTHTFQFNDSRFMVSGGNLYLKAGQSLSLQGGTTLPLTITAIDSGSPATSWSKSFVLSLQAGPANWQFAHQWKPNPYDTDADGSVTPLDIAIVVSVLNANGPTQLAPAAGGTQPPLFADVSGDNRVDLMDTAMILTYLNATGGDQGEVDLEPPSDRFFSREVERTSAPISAPSVAIDDLYLALAWDALDPAKVKRTTRPQRESPA